MSEQCVDQIRFDFLSRLPIVVEAKDVQVSSDAGILPLRQFDGQIGLTERFIDCLKDGRRPEQVGVWAVVTVARFINGIGATSGLNDAAEKRKFPHQFRMVRDESHGEDRRH